MERRIAIWGALGAVLLSVVWGDAGWAKPKLIRRLSGIKFGPSEPTAPPIQYQLDLRSAQRLSQETGRPMLIVVGGPNCVYCRKLENETLKDAALASFINSSFVPVHLDYQKDKRACEILEVKSLPTCVVLSPQADVLGGVEGFVRPPEFTKLLHQTMSYQLALQAKP